MRCDSQPRYHAPRTHPLTVRELRALLEGLPDDATLHSRSGALETFETELEVYGVRNIEGNKYRLPID